MTLQTTRRPSAAYARSLATGAGITGYSDPGGSEQANLAISAKRASAAKEYLVTRHGIDPGRITTAARGTAAPWPAS